MKYKNTDFRKKVVWCVVRSKKNVEQVIKTEYKGVYTKKIQKNKKLR